ncbi:MAG: AMP-binding protein [Brachybacterium sp.]|nr:AMP-binding protein [Brachybacterium sp.]
MVPAPPWVRPAPFDGSPGSLAEHARAVGRMMDGLARLWLGPTEPPTDLPRGFEDTALVVPTSGSTGSARSVALTRAALRSSQQLTARRLDGHGAWLPLLPPTHIAGIQVLARSHHAARELDADAPLLPRPLPDLRRSFTARTFADAARGVLDAADAAEVPAYASLVPTQLLRLMEPEETEACALARDLLGRFAGVLVGGAGTDPGVLQRARDLGAKVITTYGASETAGGCVYDGEPLPGVDLALQDAEAGTGRLLIESPTLATGYLTADGRGDRDLFTAGPDGRAFLTSDLARLDGGRLQILGRADDVIVSGGRKILPQRIERAISGDEALAAVIADCVVVGVPDREWGERLVCLIVARTPAGADSDPDPQATLPELVVGRLRTGNLAPHEVPRRVLVVPALPRLGIGKIDRAAARSLAEHAQA